MAAINDSVSLLTQNTGAKAGLTVEKARHRAEEYAQVLSWYSDP